MELTIQELHQYNSLVEVGMAAAIECPINQDHMRTLPWLDENDRVCQKCFACNTKIFFSQNQADGLRKVILGNL